MMAANGPKRQTKSKITAVPSPILRELIHLVKSATCYDEEEEEEQEQEEEEEVEDEATQVPCIGVRAHTHTCVHTYTHKTNMHTSPCLPRPDA